MSGLRVWTSQPEKVVVSIEEDCYAGMGQCRRQPQEGGPTLLLSSSRSRV